MVFGDYSPISRDISSAAGVPTMAGGTGGSWNRATVIPTRGEIDFSTPSAGVRYVAESSGSRSYNFQVSAYREASKANWAHRPYSPKKPDESFSSKGAVLRV